MIPAKEKKFNSFAFSEERNQLSRPDYLLQKAKKEQPLGSCRGPFVHCTNWGRGFDGQTLCSVTHKIIEE